MYSLALYTLVEYITSYILELESEMTLRDLLL